MVFWSWKFSKYFSWRAKRPYKKLKQLYGEKLNDFHSEKINIIPKKISEKEKERIKREIKAEISQQNIRLVFVTLISALLVVAFMWALGYFVRKHYF